MRATTVAPALWWRDASCTQVGWHAFDTEERIEADAAKRVCAACPVLEFCKASLLREEAGRRRSELTGVRAGMTGYQRYRLYGHLCPGCGGERDEPASRLCATCRVDLRAVLVNDRG